ncbi:transcriptional regulator [Bacillus cereus]|uniref:Transcriptional regulator n=1 Tax=Bacillus cereus TaxID=1396 RepID=A0A2A9U0R1_BACCE|nr:transcriptional regulator [Bacillus cereus]PEW00521.1 transcriptional regulator [Bacillus cereus]PFI17115.1 transcriptional regulator [Bacillus cereus]
MKKWNDKTKVICYIVGLLFQLSYSEKREFSFYITA